MNNVMHIAAFCAWIGTAIVCIVLIVTGIWRWLAHPKKRAERLDTAAWISVVVLGVLLLIYRQVNVAELFSSKRTSNELTRAVIYVSKIAVKLLMLGAVIACVLLLLCVVFLFVRYAISVIWRAKPGNKNSKDLAQELRDKSRELSEIMKSPILILAITCGILGVFIVIPLLMGSPSDQSLSDQSFSDQSLSETWKSGVEIIGNFGQKEDTKPIEDTAGKEDTEADRNDAKEENTQNFQKALITYILTFIIVLGVGCAVIQILYSIIYDIFVKKQSGGFIDEYSGSMGVLAVGVSILWTIQQPGVDIFSPDSNIIPAFFKSFGTVLLFIAGGILVLEIIRLLIDMREKLIRTEARYLFICLVGQASLLLLDVLISLYGIASSIIGTKRSTALDRIQDKIRTAIIAAMDRQLNNQGNYKRIFSGFKGRPTNKRGGGSNV